MDEKDEKGQIVGYRRVSSVDQNLERQLEDIKVDRIFEDKMSGKSADRPALKEMLAYVRPGDTVICWSMDRLARNLDDLRRIVHGLVERSVTIKFVKEGMVYSPEKTNSMSKLLLSIMGSFAEFERELISERQKEGVAIARRNLVYKGRKSTLTDDQILILIEQVESGKSMTEVISDISSLGIKRKSGDLVTKISRQTFTVARAEYVRRHPEIAERFPKLKTYMATEEVVQ